MNEPTKQAIIKHGQILKDAFKCYDVDALKLCKALRRLENKAHRLAEKMCNKGEMNGREETQLRKILEQVNTLLNPTGLNIPLFINTDPRGYALKIESDFMDKCRDPDSVFSKIPRDMGGYGLIAPEIEVKEART